MTTTCLVATRAIHFGACLLYFGVFAFDRLVAASISDNNETEAAVFWQSRVRCFNLILPPVILLSGISWYALVATTMSGLPFRQAIQPEILETVWSQTLFGTVWKLRLCFWIVTAIAAVFLWFCKAKNSVRKILIWMQLFLAALLLGSLAWAGHGQEDSHWHLLADIMHLLVAGLWPTGLLPLVLVLRQLRRSSEAGRAHSIAALVRRFSAMSLGSVTLLALTGWVNAWFLVGSFSNLVEQTYGRWLLVKITFFAIAVAFGAVNLLRLKPRLLAESTPPEKARATAAQLQFNVQMELMLGTAIVVVVAVLGILPPAIH
ncbi:MAG TPA: CopD family protein [Candidatus Saccharimonadales bacterium]|nr:CopD family protein [Candidatus Saccharimonadales bacterium]